MTILNGDALTQLKTLDSESIDLVITSPPYYGLRNYGVENQIGLEKTPNEYISKLMDIFNECKRVLKKTGSCWVNIGDSYMPHNGTRGNKTNAGADSLRQDYNNIALAPMIKRSMTTPSKSLIGIPERFVIAMTDNNWIRRNTIIWHKNNCMPSSAKDRFTIDFEYFYFFTKSQKYYFETQYEPSQDTAKRIKNTIGGPKNALHDYGSTSRTYGKTVKQISLNPNGRIKRCVWSINPQSFKEAHFATYPEKLIETPIKACCPSEICNKCGKPRNKILKSLLGYGIKKSNTAAKFETAHNMARLAERRQYYRSLGYETTPYIENGYSDCGCNAGFHSGIVLDPFFGAGTTGLVAKKLGRKYIGIELNPEYVEIANNRIDSIL
jgi:DNA modification methylase